VTPKKKKKSKKPNRPKTQRKSPESKLLRVLRAALRSHADETRAAAMQAYMKSAMPYHGVPMPIVRTLCKEAFRDLAFESSADWEQEVRAIWVGARFREERYVAVALTGVRAARSFQTPAALPLYEELIVSGAWWDLVDELATNRVGPILRAHPREVAPIMRRWSRSGDMWKRRTSIICQARSRARTDVALLHDCIEPSIGSTEFFLRKAIGWALREYTHVDADAVSRYVRQNEARLSGLSKREALKHVAAH
jgi:3-methyladenine DNA glycosylase AlkD